MVILRAMKDKTWITHVRIKKAMHGTYILGVTIDHAIISDGYLNASSNTKCRCGEFQWPRSVYSFTEFNPPCKRTGDWPIPVTTSFISIAMQ
ncbi:uncharacterized protein UV8b_07942 [Ustilaginoidea virens]|uniref:Uncharacterized protein n=1 Tax=Ustilaginoidea virens TaxID=1159556 RepID=A0A8E5ML28_USTVR|nr:uncharacterized protein UV8b_07942 [Ustilaginoidea virens]QUC23701.1 hypothetical protein UV8b_07942 [Ustilaginoidea virens]